MYLVWDKEDENFEEFSTGYKVAEYIQEFIDNGSHNEDDLRDRFRVWHIVEEVYPSYETTIKVSL